MVHGVTEPSDEIKKDLVSVFQKRLDDYTLELITMALARNPNTKLALQDVQVRLVDLGDCSNDNCFARVCDVCLMFVQCNGRYSCHVEAPPFP